MGIMLGNLSLTQMQKRLGIELSADDIMRFPHRQENVSQKLGEYTWHCFDIPFLIECDSEDTAKAYSVSCSHMQVKCRDKYK